MDVNGRRSHPGKMTASIPKSLDRQRLAMERLRGKNRVIRQRQQISLRLHRMYEWGSCRGLLSGSSGSGNIRASP